MEKALHKIIIISRSDTEITGVVDVGAYNDEEIEIETTEGMLTISGSGFNIIKLDVESGFMKINGYIDSLYYSDKTGTREKNIFARIFG